MTAVEVLTKVRAFLSDPNNWCQRHMTTDGSNRCLVATLRVFMGILDYEHPAVLALIDNFPERWKMIKVAKESRFSSLAGVNDAGTHQDVIDWLDRTIAAEKAKSGVEALKQHLTATPKVAAKAELELVH